MMDRRLITDERQIIMELRYIYDRIVKAEHDVKEHSYLGLSGMFCVHGDLNEAKNRIRQTIISIQCAQDREREKSST